MTWLAGARCFRVSQLVTPIHFEEFQVVKVEERFGTIRSIWLRAVARGTGEPYGRRFLLTGPRDRYCATPQQAAEWQIASSSRAIESHANSIRIEVEAIRMLKDILADRTGTLKGLTVPYRRRPRGRDAV